MPSNPSSSKRIAPPTSTGAEQSAWGTIKSAFYDISDTRPGQGFRRIAGLCGKVIFRAAKGSLNLFGYEGIETLRNPNLTTRQKILPTIAIILASAVFLPAAIISILGVSVLIPPFSIAASVTGVGRNLALYFKERAERNNLRKIVVTSDTLQNKIKQSSLVPSQQETLTQYATKQKELYNALYAIRRIVIESGDLSLDEKRDFVEAINNCITGVSKGENTFLSLTLNRELAPSIQGILNTFTQDVNDKILHYRSITEKTNAIQMTPALRASVEAYREMQGKIYSQDLPEKIKDRIVEMIETQKNSKIAVKELFSRLGNHYINAKLFPAPVVSYEYPNNDQIKQAKKAITRRFLGARAFNRREQRKALQAESHGGDIDFTERYKATYDILAKKERLGYLETAVRKRRVDVALGLLNATISITATAMLASVATPAAPLAAAALALTIVGSILTVASLGIAIDLAGKERRANAKVAKPAHKVAKVFRSVPKPTPTLTEEAAPPVFMPGNKPAGTSEWQPAQEQRRDDDEGHEPAARAKVGAHRPLKR